MPDLNLTGTPATQPTAPTTQPAMPIAQPGAPTGARAPAPSPIADLSYRNYDGPLHTRAARWWTIALASVRMARRKKGYALAALLTLAPYAIMAIMLFLQSQFSSTVGQGASTQQDYAPRFLNCFTVQLLMLFILTLMVGAGSIALDNQANALLVYLSKPITKSDYLIGKWAGVFYVIFELAFAPAAAVYLYGLISFGRDGFFSHEPWLLPRLFLVALMCAAVHASLSCAVSAWSKSPRLAGAVYATLYFLTLIVSQIVWGIRYNGRIDEGFLLRHLSIQGVIRGTAQSILGVTERVPHLDRAHGEFQQLVLHPPSVWSPLTAIALILIVGGLVMTRVKIQAVEVVRG